MKITVHTVAIDDDNGTHGGAYATEDAMYDYLFMSMGGHWTSYDRSDFEEWLKANPDGTEHDFWEEHRSDLDSYTCDEITLDIPLTAQPIPATVEERLAQINELQARLEQLNHG